MTSRSRAVVIRPDTIETCYGYWVANCFVEDVDDKLKAAAADKDEFLKGLCNWLKGRGRQRTIERYRESLKRVQNAVRDNEIDLGREDARKRWDRKFESIDDIEKRMVLLAENLDRKAWRERLSRPIVSKRVPEIWDDVVAREAFEESFFESLAEQSLKGIGKRSRASDRLLGAIGIEDEAKATDIRDKLEESLTDPDWYLTTGRAYHLSLAMEDCHLSLSPSTRLRPPETIR